MKYLSKKPGFQKNYAAAHNFGSGSFVSDLVLGTADEGESLLFSL